jgi:hypothetical protein
MKRNIDMKAPPPKGRHLYGPRRLFLLREKHGVSILYFIWLPFLPQILLLILRSILLPVLLAVPVAILLLVLSIVILMVYAAEYLTACFQEHMLGW